MVRRRRQCPEKWYQLGFSDQAEENQMARVRPISSHPLRKVGHVENPGQKSGLGAPILPPSSLGQWLQEEAMGLMVSNHSSADPWAASLGLVSVWSSFTVRGTIGKRFCRGHSLRDQHPYRNPHGMFLLALLTSEAMQARVQQRAHGNST